LPAPSGGGTQYGVFWRGCFKRLLKRWVLRLLVRTGCHEGRALASRPSGRPGTSAVAAGIQVRVARMGVGDGLRSPQRYCLLVRPAPLDSAGRHLRVPGTAKASVVRRRLSACLRVGTQARVPGGGKVTVAGDQERHHKVEADLNPGRPSGVARSD